MIQPPGFLNSCHSSDECWPKDGGERLGSLRARFRRRSTENWTPNGAFFVSYGELQPSGRRAQRAERDQ